MIFLSKRKKKVRPTYTVASKMGKIKSVLTYDLNLLN